MANIITGDAATTIIAGAADVLSPSIIFEVYAINTPIIQGFY
jgi:hypothetical protein